MFSQTLGTVRTVRVSEIGIHQTRVIEAVFRKPPDETVSEINSYERHT
jgi:hypothetical protein